MNRWEILRIMDTVEKNQMYYIGDSGRENW